MNYYNWQAVHKSHFGIRKIKDPENTNFAIDDLNDAQKVVWQDLLKTWRSGQLVKLLALAKNYDKASDTFRTCRG